MCQCTTAYKMMSKHPTELFPSRGKETSCVWPPWWILSFGHAAKTTSMQKAVSDLSVIVSGEEGVQEEP
jgi:hypothetical protein